MDTLKKELICLHLQLLQVVDFLNINKVLQILISIKDFDIFRMKPQIAHEFLSITAGYKYKRGLAKIASGNIKPKRNNSQLKLYRAYDKERLLEQIDSRMDTRNNAISQNKILKQQLGKASNVGEKGSTMNQTKMMLSALQQQNLQLCLQLRNKKQQIERLKRLPQYTSFLEMLIQYETNKQQLKRIRDLIRQNKQQKLQQKLTKDKVKRQLLNQIIIRQKSMNQKLDHNNQIRLQIQNMQQQLNVVKSKNNQLSKNKKKLQQNISELKISLQKRATMSKIPEKNRNCISSKTNSYRNKQNHSRLDQYQIKFNSAIKIKDKSKGQQNDDKNKMNKKQNKNKMAVQQQSQNIKEIYQQYENKSLKKKKQDNFVLDSQKEQKTRSIINSQNIYQNTYVVQPSKNAQLLRQKNTPQIFYQDVDSQIERQISI